MGSRQTSITEMVRNEDRARNGIGELKSTIIGAKSVAQTPIVIMRTNAPAIYSIGTTTLIST